MNFATRHLGGGLAGAFAILAMSGWGSEAQAQAQPTFACDSSIYLTMGANPTQLVRVDTSTNPFDFSDTVGPGDSPGYNGAGFDPFSGYIYATRWDGTTHRLLRIGSDGSVRDMGRVVGGGINTTDFQASFATGVVGADGFLYVKHNGGAGSDTMFRIDLGGDTVGDRSATAIPLTLNGVSTAIASADSAWHNGLIYAHDHVNDRLYTVDPSSGAITLLPQISGTGGAFGSMISATNGVFGRDNNGGFYRFDTTTGRAVLISSSPTGGGDGAKCPTTAVTLPADTQITKTDSAQEYLAGQQVQYMIVVSNKGPFGVQNALVNDPLPSGISQASWSCGSPTGGASCSSTATQSGAIVDFPVNLPANSSVTITFTIDVPADYTGDLVNTTTVVNPGPDVPDPDPDNNSATDTDTSTRLTLQKTVINDDGGTATEANFTLSASGPTPISGTSGDPAVTNATILAGDYTLSESAPSGYQAVGPYSCSVNGAAAVDGNTLSLAVGDVAVCTITNDDQPATLTLQKTVVNDNGGTAAVADFTLSASGPTPISGTSGDAAVTNALVDAGSYTLSESGPAGYAASLYSCSIDGGAAVDGNNLTLGSGQNAVCTITNNDEQATLTLQKAVVNDDGGTAVVADFMLSASGPTPISGTSGDPAVTNAPVDAGAYTLSETGPAGYAALYSCSIDGGAAVDGINLTLDSGQSAVCTITNDDQPATLTLQKTVVNDNGGTAAVADFTLLASGPTPISGTSGDAAVTNAPVDAGSYTLSETGPTGYADSLYSCSVDGGAAVDGNNLTLGSGQSAVCTITNDDEQATLTLQKTVVNDNGGTATVADFTLSASGPTPISGTSGDPAVTNAPVDAGAYTLSETGPAGYGALYSCSVDGGAAVDGANLILDSGQNAVCTITNDDEQAILTLEKVVVNDNGGTAAAADFTLLADGPTPISGTSGDAAVTNAPVDAGSYTLSETGPAGYAASLYSCSIDGGAAVDGNDLTLGSGQNAVCTITNNDQSATLTLRKTVVNDDGGTATVADFTLSASGPIPISGASGDPAVTNAPIDAGTYTLSETGPSGYAPTLYSCSIDGGTAVDSNTLNLGSGQSAVCEITNDDFAPVKALTGEDGIISGVAEPGETLTYTLTLTNNGASTATYDLKDNIDDNTTYVAGSATVNGIAHEPTGPDPLLWDDLPVPAGSTARVVYSVKVADPLPDGVTTIGNAATDDCALNPDACVTIPAAGKAVPSKALTGEDGIIPDAAEPGETLTYTVILTNNDGNPAPYDLKDDIDDATIYVTGSASIDGTPREPVGADPLTWDNLVVPANGTLTAVYSVKVADPLPDGVTEIRNAATDDCDANPDACVTTPAAGKAEPSKALTGESGVAPDVAEPGETLTYTITLTNGHSQAAPYDLVDNIDDNTAYVAGSATVDGAAREPTGSDPLLWSDLIIPANGAVNVVYQVRVADLLPEGVTSIGNVAYDEGDPEPKCDVMPTPPNCVPTPAQRTGLELVKKGAYDHDGNAAAIAGDKILYTFTVTNTGNVPLAEVTPVDEGPTFNGMKGTGALSPFTPAPLTLNPGRSQVFQATYTLSQTDIDNGAGIEDGVRNMAIAMGYANGTRVTGTPVESKESVWSLALPAPKPLTVVKQALVRAVRRGEQAPFIIQVVNDAGSPASGITVIDTVPPGFRYVEDSATVDGVEVSPEIAGRQIRFTGITVPGNGEVQIRLRLLALSSAGPGEHVNLAHAEDRSGHMSNQARAAVEILAEPVFDCGDIVGRVFDDRNGNGYQDQGEPGLPGVRLATVKGWLVTTDAHGRFHVACADLPDQRIGSNFIMKLDTRTLPSGYRVTTENPRVVRLTAGKMTKLDFGASIGRVVRLDLTGEAFEPGRVDLRSIWVAGIDELIEVLSEERSALQLFYIDAGSDLALAKERMRLMKKLISERWRERPRAYSLEIETRLEARGEP
ncbi:MULTISPECIES: DUF6923 family protein [Chelativorans]|uniref:Conserved repeat domain n=1 Tax=Chelativorans sp. (strain BNC1) TaxID=266779 RepID=Q11MC2_CHESB|nr:MULTISPECIES: DUF11 domain-containing protein [Chelativorans]